ncbi:MAG: SPOR domain-containing protein [Gammaproteobacteria bacterium]
MDQELKQRLIGAIVITALAAIFVPMLFDDPVDESGQMVSELVIPEAPVESFEDTASRLPSDHSDIDEDYAVVEETSVEASDFQTESRTAEPVDDGFEPEPFVEEPVFEAEIDSEPDLAADTNAASPLTGPTSEPEPASARKSQIKSPVANATDSSSYAAGWYIQMGSFSQKENAFSLRDKLRAQGFPAFVDEASVGGNKSYRLVVGPKHDKSSAELLQAKLDKQSHTKSLLMSVGQIGDESQSQAGAKSPISERSSTPQSAMIRWYIQLGSFSKRDNAFSLRDKLRAQGFPASIDEVVTAHGRSYRLRVGPELDKKRAEVMQSKLEKQNRLDSLLVSE